MKTQILNKFLESLFHNLGWVNMEVSDYITFVNFYICNLESFVIDGRINTLAIAEYFYNFVKPSIL